LIFYEKMGEVKGFLKYKRQDAGLRPVEQRIHDFRELDLHLTPDQIRQETLFLILTILYTKVNGNALVGCFMLLTTFLRSRVGSVLGLVKPRVLFRLTMSL
jgi:hypothetical protein